MRRMIDNTMAECVIPDEMTKIVEYAFYKHTALNQLQIGSGIKSIGNYAFNGCTGLVNVNIPESVESIGNYAFAGCTGLKTLVYNPTKFFAYMLQNNTALESLSAPNIVDTIATYALDGCSKLKNIDSIINNLAASGSTSKGILDYALRGAGKDNEASDGIRINPTNAIYIGTYALAEANVTYVEMTPYGISSNAFRNVKNLEEVILHSASNAFKGSYIFYQSGVKKVDISELTNLRIYDYTFAECLYLEEFKAPVSLNSSYKYIYTYCFYKAGSKREDLNTRLSLDFSSTANLTEVREYSFGSLVNADVTLPSTVTKIYANSFNGCTGLNLFLNSSPTLSNVNAFANCKNLRIFTEFGNMATLAAMTNWTSYSDYICGYRKGSDFADGVFPTTTPDGSIDVLWYTDKSLTTIATTIDADTTYYCILGPVYLTNVTGLNCTVTVTDAESGVVYNAEDRIILGRTINVTFTPNEGSTIPYMIDLNGTKYNLSDFNNTITGHVVENDVSITGIYWDGETLPLNPVFSENSWTLIKEGITSRTGFAIGWKIGDTKSITTSDGRTYTLRICDTKEGRYATTDGGTTNAVLEFVEGLPNTYTVNSTQKEGAWSGGGWAECDLNNNTLPSILETLPEDLQGIISEVSIPGYSGTGASPRTAVSKLFIASNYEISGTNGGNNGSSTEAVDQFEYYAEQGYTNLKKYRIGSTTNEYFWTRSPFASYANSWCVWDGSGFSSYIASYAFAVAPCFAI